MAIVSLSLKALRGEVSGRSQQGLGVEPRVPEAVCRAGPLFGDVFHHGQQEGAELSGLLQGPLVLLYEHLV